MDQKSFGREDGEGGTVRLTLWNHPGNGIYGMYARCNRVVNAMEQLLGGEVYHYHSKMILKDPEVGGAWAWHQDYGYWYDNYVLYPLMSSVSIHRSDQNRSSNPRWSLICCYNAARNNPYREAHHPSYTPLEKVPDSAIKEIGMTRFEDDESDVAFLDPDSVPTANNQARTE